MTPMSLPDEAKSPDPMFLYQDGCKVYVGPDRRGERRRASRLTPFEKLLRDFGLDRRILVDRRQADTSWLLVSERAA